MRLLSALTAVGFLIAMSVEGMAQTSDTVAARIGTVWLHLGMPETAVKEALSARYDLRPVDGLTGVLVVREKATPVTLGSINFSKGRLVMVTEDWDSVDRSEAAIGMLLFKTLSELTTSQVGQWHGASKCDVGTARSDEPRADYVQMIVRCGEKTVKLTLQQLIGYSGTLSIQVQTGELPER